MSDFGTIPACDGHTHGQTHDDNIYRASTESRGKKVKAFSVQKTVGSGADLRYRSRQLVGDVSYKTSSSLPLLSTMTAVSFPASVSLPLASTSVYCLVNRGARVSVNDLPRVAARQRNSLESSR